MQELSLNVMDVVQNSISAGASLVEISLEQRGCLMTVTITDNGRGMTPQQVRDVQNPFYTTRTTRSVGLGVPFFKMASEMTCGSFSIVSQQGEGTSVTAIFDTTHIDMMPLGDINQTMLLLICCNPNMDFTYKRDTGKGSFGLDTRDMREQLGEEVPLSDPYVMEWVKQYLEENENSLQ